MIIRIETVGATGMQMHLVSPKPPEGPQGHWLWSEWNGWKPPKYVFTMTSITAELIP